MPRRLKLNGFRLNSYFSLFFVDISCIPQSSLYHDYLKKIFFTVLQVKALGTLIWLFRIYHNSFRHVFQEFNIVLKMVHMNLYISLVRLNSVTGARKDV